MSNHLWHCWLQDWYSIPQPVFPAPPHEPCHCLHPPNCFGAGQQRGRGPGDVALLLPDGSQAPFAPGQQRRKPFRVRVFRVGCTGKQPTKGRGGAPPPLLQEMAKQKEPRTGRCASHPQASGLKPDREAARLKDG